MARSRFLTSRLGLAACPDWVGKTFLALRFRFSVEYGQAYVPAQKKVEKLDHMDVNPSKRSMIYFPDQWPCSGWRSYY